ncbi:hypothetical protein IQ22_01051 [Pseudomonas duriflava]|uniref:Uncharacterized protein n=1 Tax=Pseudomonas duriflava TaxID=459528 RepID=A0A562QK82_9PSED|nr:hypothetical protein IQ22_01051 [Pseudomonas duriflava]
MTTLSSHIPTTATVSSIDQRALILAMAGPWATLDIVYSLTPWPEDDSFPPTFPNSLSEPTEYRQYRLQ